MSWDAAAYAANAGFVPAPGQAGLDLLAPQPGEAILDLGCGDVPPDARARVIAAAETLLAPALRDDRGHWIADYVRLRWQARKPD